MVLDDVQESFVKLLDFEFVLLVEFLVDSPFVVAREVFHLGLRSQTFLKLLLLYHNALQKLTFSVWEVFREDFILVNALNPQANRNCKDNHQSHHDCK